MKMKSSLGLCLALMVFLASDGIIRGTEAADRKKDEACEPADNCKKADGDKDLVCLGKKCVEKPGDGTVKKDGACSEAKQCEGGAAKMQCKDGKCEDLVKCNVGPADGERHDESTCQAGMACVKKEKQGTTDKPTIECVDKEKECGGKTKCTDCKNPKCTEDGSGPGTGPPSGAQKSAQGLGFGMMTLMMMATTLLGSYSVPTLGM